MSREHRLIRSQPVLSVKDIPVGSTNNRLPRITRHWRNYPELKYVPDWPEGTYPTGGVHYRFFDVMVDPESGRYLSEGYGFCRLWDKIGGEICIDANSDLTHEGRRALAHAVGCVRR